MSRDPAEWDVFDWDQHNIDHLAQHGIDPNLVAQIYDNDPKLVAHSGGGRSGSHKMIGPDKDGTFWTIIVLELRDDRWRPITGWESTRTEVRIYYGQG
jgi:hypothetical protein